MKKISYAQLQKKYPHKLVAMDRDETHVLAVGTDALEVVEKLKKKNIETKDVVIEGPIQEPNKTYVYLSLPHKNY